MSHEIRIKLIKLKMRVAALAVGCPAIKAVGAKCMVWRRYFLAEGASRVDALTLSAIDLKRCIDSADDKGCRA